MLDCTTSSKDLLHYRLQCKNLRRPYQVLEPNKAIGITNIGAASPKDQAGDCSPAQQRRETPVDHSWGVGFHKPFVVVLSV